MKTSAKIFITALLFSQMSFGTVEIIEGGMRAAEAAFDASMRVGACLVEGYCSADIQAQNVKLQEAARNGTISEEKATQLIKRNNIVLRLLSTNSITQEEAVLLVNE